MSDTPRPIELLAPARNAEIAIEALKHGADAIYIGASSHGARQAAANSVADIARITDYAHRFRARVYVTLNTIIYNTEIHAVERLVAELYRIGVDALIVQDMSLLRMDIPPIALHASTQCDIRSADKAKFLAAAGFSQLVLPREMTLDEMHSINDAVPGVALEAFVHGALCVSYSGDCQAGFAALHRSANRGECPQICRHSFTLTDAAGNRLMDDRHLLSLRDLNRSEIIPEMLAAGISSFKIEGRLKDVAYVKNTVAAYRHIIDEAIRRDPTHYTRASAGNSSISFTPSLSESFNRGFTTYFTTSSRPAGQMASMLTPKWTGLPVGKVKGGNPRAIRANLTTDISNGDGLGYFDAAGRFCGFRVNRVEAGILYPATPQNIASGTTLYRNHNRLREEMLSSDTARRTIKANLTLRTTPSGIALDAATSFGPAVTLSEDMTLEKARNDQSAQHLKTLTKTGDSIFTADTVTDLASGIFIPLSRLTALRRDTLQALEYAIITTHPFEYRHPENKTAKYPTDRLTYHDNIANRLAETFYREHGVKEIQPAYELLDEEARKGLPVMTTRYCLRREAGRCLRESGGEKWPRDLIITSGPLRFRLSFDCTHCRMHLIPINTPK